MSIIGSSWREEESVNDQYKDITGEECDDILMDIERKLTNVNTSSVERKKLYDLLNKIQQQ